MVHVYICSSSLLSTLYNDNCRICMHCWPSSVVDKPVLFCCLSATFNLAVTWHDSYNRHAVRDCKKQNLRSQTCFGLARMHQGVYENDVSFPGIKILLGYFANGQVVLYIPRTFNLDTHDPGWPQWARVFWANLHSSSDEKQAENREFWHYGQILTIVYPIILCSAVQYAPEGDDSSPWDEVHAPIR